MTYALVSRREPQLPRLPCRIRGARGRMPLHEAAQNGHAAVVGQLISAGATVNAADKFTRNAADKFTRGPEGFSGRFWGGSVALTK